MSRKLLGITGNGPQSLTPLAAVLSGAVVGTATMDDNGALNIITALQTVNSSSDYVARSSPSTAVLGNGAFTTLPLSDPPLFNRGAAFGYTAPDTIKNNSGSNQVMLLTGYAAFSAPPANSAGTVRQVMVVTSQVGTAYPLTQTDNSGALESVSFSFLVNIAAGASISLQAAHNSTAPVTGAAQNLNVTGVLTATLISGKGDNGSNAYTTTTAPYTQPAQGATVDVAVVDGAWETIGQTVFVQDGGHYVVTAKPSPNVLRLLNPNGLAYASNAAAASVIATGSMVSPAGVAGAVGVAATSRLKLTSRANLASQSIPNGAGTLLDLPTAYYSEFFTWEPANKLLRNTGTVTEYVEVSVSAAWAAGAGATTSIRIIGAGLYNAANAYISGLSTQKKNDTVAETMEFTYDMVVAPGQAIGFFAQHNNATAVNTAQPQNVTSAALWAIRLSADTIKGVDGPGYKATSATSRTIAASGAQTFATQPGLAYTVGSRVRASGNAANYMEGVVTAYDFASGALTFTADRSIGAGNFTAWNINLAGDVATGGSGLTALDRFSLDAVGAEMVTLASAALDGEVLQLANGSAATVDNTMAASHQRALVLATQNGAIGDVIRVLHLGRYSQTSFNTLNPGRIFLGAPGVRYPTNTGPNLSAGQHNIELGRSLGGGVIDFNLPSTRYETRS